MRLVLTTAAALAFATIAPGTTGEAYAHGGAYRGPAGEIPPETREPHDPPPPGSGPGPSTPHGDPGGPGTGTGVPGAPGTGGGSGGGARTPGSGPNNGGGSLGPGTGAPGRKSGGVTGPGYEDWTFWWNFNKDPILRVRDAVHGRQRGSRTVGWLHRTGRTAGGSQIVTATQAAIRNRIVPALRDLLEQDDLNFDIRSAAAIALAKIGDPEVTPHLIRMTRNERATGRYHKIVVESAALSLGLLQDDTDETRELLLEVVADRDRDGSFVRPFAAVSLGLLAGAGEGGVDPAVTETLLRVLAGKEPGPDVKPACLLALGLAGDEAAVPDLLHMLERGQARSKRADALGDVELAYAVEALGRIGAPGTAEDPTAVVDALLQRTDPRRFRNKALRRSVAIALSHVAANAEPGEQRRVVNALARVATDGKDASECNFAMISLGRLGAAADVDPAVRQRIVRVLGWQLEKASPAAVKQPFAALALGLVGRGIVEAGGPVPEDFVRAPLRAKFAEARNPRVRGAYAIASGLVRDPRAVEALHATFLDRGSDTRLRGYCALSLGMIGDRTASASIARVLADEDENDRTLRVQTAIAAGLVGDGAVIEPLVKLLTSDESQYVLGSAALALGQIGDERAIGPLVAIANGEGDHPNLTRALATVALGQIGDRADLPVLSRVAEDVNYRAHVPALAELLTIL
jgi:HEAT repeat protein